jgi:hypothetical protein
MSEARTSATRTRATRTSATRAAIQGLILAARAPGLLAAIAIVTLLAAIPFVFVIEPPVTASLGLQPEGRFVGSSDIDPEWWLEFRRHATGLAATFTPAILGFAAPLDNLSALLDGTRRPLALALPVAVAALAWAFLWGGVINRFAQGDASARAFVAAGTEHFGRLLAITALAAAASLVIYLTLHPLLLGVAYEAIAAHVSTERDAFLVRVALYLVFGGVLAIVNAVFAFARIHVVAEGERRLSHAIAHGWAFVRGHLTSVGFLYVMFLLLFAIAMVVYGFAELVGASRIGGWRAIVVGQAFILFRLGLRLALTASQVRLVAQTSEASPQTGTQTAQP